MSPDEEVLEILNNIPKSKQTTASWQEACGGTNARLIWNPTIERLEIFPVNGGWLGVKFENLMGDLAPFSD